MKINFRLLSLIVLLLFFIPTQACQKASDPKVPRASIEYGRLYTVGIKTQGYEAKGKLKLEKNGDFYFMNEAPNSTLFGMEEWVNSTEIKVKYMDMEWTSCDAETETRRLYRALSLLFTNRPTKTAEDSIDGKAAICHHYQGKDKEVLFWFEKSSKTQIKIIATENGRTFEINF